MLNPDDNSGIASSGKQLLKTAVVVGIAKLAEPAVVAAGNAAAVAAGSSYVGTGRALSVAAGRLSYCYGLKGLAVTVDTACSSSLVSLHFAAGAILDGSATRSLSAGVNLPMNFETTATFAAAGEPAPSMLGAWWLWHGSLACLVEALLLKGATAGCKPDMDSGRRLAGRDPPCSHGRQADNT